VVPAAGGARAPRRGLLLDPLRLELDGGGAGHRRTHGGRAAVDGPADERRVRGGRVAGRGAGPPGRGGRVRAEGRGGRGYPGGDGRREEQRVQEQRRRVDGESQGGQQGRRQLRQEHRRVCGQVRLKGGVVCNNEAGTN
jgi:hypothetical protein